MAEFTDWALLEMDQPVHSCHFCVGARCLNGSCINIKALDIGFNIKIYTFSGFFSCILPAFLRYQMLPALGQKMTVQSRCHIRCHHCRLNGKGTASAERIDKNTVLFPGSKHQKSAGKSLGNRCLDSHLAIPSLMKGYS